MGRVHHQDGVEFVADAGPRLHVAHPGQQERRQHVAVRRALPHAAATSSSSRSRGVSSSRRTRGSISGWRRTTFGSRVASSAETGRSWDRKPRSPKAE